MKTDVLDPDQLLSTTRCVRRRLDLTRPVDPALLLECVELALQAPMSASEDHWGHVAFVVVRDAERRAAVAELYRAGLAERLDETSVPRDPQLATESRGMFDRIETSSAYLAAHLHGVPVLVLPCVLGDTGAASPAARAATYGSVIPAAWSFMLAARARGLGVAWTTVHLNREAAVREVLGIPAGWSQTVLLPVAHHTGTTFSPARRPSAADVTHWDSW